MWMQNFLIFFQGGGGGGFHLQTWVGQNFRKRFTISKPIPWKIKSRGGGGGLLPFEICLCNQYTFFLKLEVYHIKTCQIECNIVNQLVSASIYCPQFCLPRYFSDNRIVLCKYVFMDLLSRFTLFLMKKIASENNSLA